MSNVFYGTGNVGTDPEIKYLQIGDRQTKVASLRVKFDFLVEDERGNLVQDEKTSFWKDVQIWNERAEKVAKLIRKGARVCVNGKIKGNNYTKDDGTEVKQDFILADDIYVALSRVDSINFRARTEAPVEA